MSFPQRVDVVVVGAGNAALCAALAAREAGADVIVCESANEVERGGNTRYAAGQMRVGYGAQENLVEIVEGLDRDGLSKVDIGTYTPEDFFGDVARLTQYRTNAELMDVVTQRSFDTLRWMRAQGVRFQLSFGRQAQRDGDRFRFWGNLPCEAWGGGAGMLQAYEKRAERIGVPVRCGVAATGLLTRGERVCGIEYADRGERRRLDAGAVVLACGGFEANAQMRATYLGPNWDLAKVRGTRFNTGRGFAMALEAGAAACGQLSGAHSTCWDLNAPESGDLAVGDSFQKHSYPFGIMVNARGERFVDEGADFRNYTYAKYGRELLRQPGMFAWQVFDARGIAMLRDEYRVRQVTKARADTLEALASQLSGVDARRFVETVRRYNASVPDGSGTIDASVKDGRATRGLAVPKSNWAFPIDRPPFEAYAVTTGITFTFGGLKINALAEVQNAAGHSIPGLYAAGEIVGGLFYHNYPGGSGLTAGAVFGRIAGVQSAACGKAA